jgi:thiosulfate/3-mercaptopyruvate sulfurtransferase
MKVLISIGKLKSILSCSVDLKIRNILIIDTRPFSDYLKGHIPGAINVDLMQFHWIDTSADGIKEFIRQSRYLLSNIGVREKDLVVFYDDTTGPSAARGLWLLLYFSHKRVAILNGGFNKWKEKGHDIQKSTNQFRYSRFHGKVNPELLATAKDILSSLVSGKSLMTNIIDSRSKPEFDGTIVRGGRRGHIPTAIHIDWKMNLAGGFFKTCKELAKLYCTLPKDKQIITYCQGGYRAANTFLALRLLGYDKVKVYLGSWGEWSSRHDLPVEYRK